MKREDRKEKFLKKIETFNIENYETTIKIPIYREISDFNNTAIWSVNIVGNSNLKQSHIMDKYFGLIYEKNVIKLGPKDQLGENFFTYTGIKDREQKNKIKEKACSKWILEQVEGPELFEDAMKRNEKEGEYNLMQRFSGKYEENKEYIEDINNMAKELIKATEKNEL